MFLKGMIQLRGDIPGEVGLGAQGWEHRREMSWGGGGKKIF
jgi:hypothetical protein